MNYTTKLISVAAFGFALASVSLSAQSASSSESSSLLGKRYAGVDLFIDDLRDFGDNGYGPVLSVNLPVSKTVDAGFAIGYESFDSDNVDLTGTWVEASGTAYNRQDGYSPFITGTIGHAWSDLEVANFPQLDDTDDYSFFSVGIGVEVPVVTEKTAVTVGIHYSDAFDSGVSDAWSFKAGLHHWVTDTIALKGSIEVIEDDATVFTLGARFVF